MMFMGRGASIKGRIVCGVGKGAFFTQLGWVKEQCQQKLGFVPYPGTLNLEIEEDVLSLLGKACEECGHELVPPDSSSCAGMVVRVQVGDVPAAVVFLDESVRWHPANTIEIIAPVSLKSVLGAGDGETVEITLDAIGD